MSFATGPSLCYLPDFLMSADFAVAFGAVSQMRTQTSGNLAPPHRVDCVESYAADIRAGRHRPAVSGRLRFAPQR